MNRFRFWWRYLQHDTPWDTRQTPPEIIKLVDELTPARALDIGCGTGTTSHYLAARGWTVVGIDFIASAVRAARHESRRMNTPVQFYVANAAKLDFLTGPFNFVIDIGCLHSLNPTEQSGYAAHLSRLTTPGAIYALYAFTPRVINRRKSGLTVETISALFAPYFELKSYTLGKDKGTGPSSGWYCLRRIQI